MSTKRKKLVSANYHVFDKDSPSHCNYLLPLNVELVDELDNDVDDDDDLER